MYMFNNLVSISLAHNSDWSIIQFFLKVYNKLNININKSVCQQFPLLTKKTDKSFRKKIYFSESSTSNSSTHSFNTKALSAQQFLNAMLLLKKKSQ